MKTTLARWSVLIASLFVLARPAAGQDFDRWYTVSMAGQRAGWMHAQQETKDGRITSLSALSLEIRREAIHVTIAMGSDFVETTDGKPISMRVDRKLGTAPVVQTFTFGDANIEMVTKEGNQESKSVVALPTGTWLTPAAASQYTQQRLKAGADTIVVRTIDPMGGTDPIVMTRSDMSKTTLDVLGQTMSVIKSTVTTSSEPGIKTVEYLDDQGVPVRFETSFGGFSLEMMAAEKDAALAANEAPELMIDTFIRPAKPIPSARRTTKAAYILSVKSDQMPALPDTGAQKVKSLDPTRVALTVATRNPTPAPQADLTDPSFLAASSVLNTEDEQIKALKDKALKSASASPTARAEALRRFVHRYIKTKDLTVAFATASEVARTREGDCTEHGVLLAALLRADGIPARVASGLIYVDQFAGQSGIFGYHMWAQALLEIDGQKRWVDLDATLPDGTPFDATHITLAVSSLSDNENQSTLLSIAPLLGNLQIQVESIE